MLLSSGPGVSFGRLPDRFCLVASVAWRHGASLLSADADRHRVSAVMGITNDTA